MREILFRAKRTYDGKWVEGIYMPRPNSPKVARFYIVEIGIAKWYEVDPETVCQYTGLTDKNGKRIFEGDIVTISEDGYKEDPDYLGLFPQGQGHFKNYVVEFLDGLYQITYICKRDGDIMHLCKNLVYSRYLEVIGNIFDNPELVN